jgi:hypothetical protein
MATGFVVVGLDMMAIYAVGVTKEAAQADYRKQSGESFGAGPERCILGTDRLIDRVMRHGGDPRGLRWHIRADGVADLLPGAMVSVDNGWHLVDAEDLTEEQIAQHWDALVHAMDDDTREQAHAGSFGPEAARDFLVRYLALATEDLVIS